MTRSMTADAGRRARAGYTLVEVLIAGTVLVLVMGGTLSMFTTMLRLGGTIGGSVSATMDARNAIQRITGDFREARRFSLQDSPTYDATDASNSVVAVTAVQLTFPAAHATVTVSKDASGGTQVSVPNATAPALWDRSDGGTLLFFRANWHQPEGADGTSNPNTGRSLWARGVENGTAVDGPLVKSLAPTLNAVQFIQPYVPGSSPPVPIPNEIKIKLTTSGYDPVHGAATSDSSAGGVTQLTGECVFLRDHDPSGTTSVGVNGRAQN